MTVPALQIALRSEEDFSVIPVACTSTSVQLQSDKKLEVKKTAGAIQWTKSGEKVSVISDAGITVFDGSTGRQLYHIDMAKCMRTTWSPAGGFLGSISKRVEQQGMCAIFASDTLTREGRALWCGAGRNLP